MGLSLWRSVYGADRIVTGSCVLLPDTVFFNYDIQTWLNSSHHKAAGTEHLNAWSSLFVVYIDFMYLFNVNTCGLGGLCVCMYVCDIIHTCICMNVIFMNVCFAYELFWVFPVLTPVYHLWDHWGKTILSRHGTNTFRIHGHFFSSVAVTNTSHLLELKQKMNAASTVVQTSSLEGLFHDMIHVCSRLPLCLLGHRKVPCILNCILPYYVVSQERN